MQFKHIRPSRNGQRPKTTTAPHMIEKAHRIVLDGRRVKVSKIADILGSLHDSVYQIFTEELEIKQYSVRCCCLHRSKN